MVMVVRVVEGVDAARRELTQRVDGRRGLKGGPDGGEAPGGRVVAVAAAAAATAAPGIGVRRRPDAAAGAAAAAIAATSQQSGRREGRVG
jgi:hypothetical protein